MPREKKYSTNYTNIQIKLYACMITEIIYNINDDKTIIILSVNWKT